MTQPFTQPAYGGLKKITTRNPLRACTFARDDPDSIFNVEVLKLSNSLIAQIPQHNTTFSNLSLYFFMKKGSYQKGTDFPGSAFSSDSGQINDFYKIIGLPASSFSVSHATPNVSATAGWGTEQTNIQKKYESDYLKFIYTVCKEEVIYKKRVVGIQDPEEWPKPLPYYRLFFEAAYDQIHANQQIAH